MLMFFLRLARVACLDAVTEKKREREQVHELFYRYVGFVVKPQYVYLCKQVDQTIDHRYTDGVLALRFGKISKRDPGFVIMCNILGFTQYPFKENIELPSFLVILTCGFRCETIVYLCKQVAYTCTIDHKTDGAPALRFGNISRRDLGFVMYDILGFKHIHSKKILNFLRTQLYYTISYNSNWFKLWWNGVQGYNSRYTINNNPRM